MVQATLLKRAGTVLKGSQTNIINKQTIAASVVHFFQDILGHCGYTCRNWRGIFSAKNY